MTASLSVGNLTPLVLGLIDWLDGTGGWFDDGIVPIPAPEVVGTTIDIRPVPLPAAAWLLLGALGVLGGLRRRGGI